MMTINKLERIRKGAVEAYLLSRHLFGDGEDSHDKHIRTFIVPTEIRTVHHPEYKSYTLPPELTSSS
jgi:hypothetical protein